MELHIHPASPNCVAVLAATACLAQDIEIHHVDLFNNAQRDPAFLRMNPNGLVPVLADGAFVLWETTAILQYLASLDPQARLLAHGERERADVARWLAWGLAHWNPALQPFIYERMFKPLKGLGSPDEERLASLKPRLDAVAGVLDEHLAATRFVCGERIGICDLYLAAYPIYAPQAGIEFDAYPHLQRWLERVHAMPEWRHAAGKTAS